MLTLALDRPWLALYLGRPMRELSWALNCPGFVTTRRVLRCEVWNADLPVDLDVKTWGATELETRGGARRDDMAVGRGATT